MTATITFANTKSWDIFRDTIEGVAEVAADDGDSAKEIMLDDLLAVADLAIKDIEGKADLPDALVSLAREIVSAARDHNVGTEDEQDEDDEDRLFLIEGEVVIEGALPDERNGTVHCLPCAEAIAEAIELIDLAHHDDMSDDIKRVLWTLEAILEQRGCEDNCVGPRDGLLTSVMDVVIYG